MHLKGCTNGIYKQENNIGYHATRNPFNRGVATTDTFIILIKISYQTVKN